jgi:hypothetical protein
VEAAGFESLEIRAFPDGSDSWDPSVDAMPEVDEELMLSVPLEGLSFPYAYHLERDVGPAAERQWRVVGWIARTAGSDAPVAGEWWGTTRYEARRCGNRSDYCLVKPDVDILIDALVE